MNTRQKRVLWIGIALLMLIWMFPRWTHTAARRDEPVPYYRSGHYFLLDRLQGEYPPAIKDGRVTFQLDLSSIVLPTLIVIAGTAGLLVTLIDK